MGPASPQCGRNTNVFNPCSLKNIKIRCEIVKLKNLTHKSTTELNDEYALTFMSKWKSYAENASVAATFDYSGKLI
jgi:hypothetical protein